MSLTSLIEKNLEVKNFLKENSPARTNFVTNLDIPAFSKDCPMKAPFDLVVSHDAALTGTAADYMFRFVTAHTINSGKERVFSDLVCEKAMSRLEFREDKDFVSKVNAEYNKSMSNFRRFVSGENIELCILSEGALRLAYLDTYIRGGLLPSNPSDMYDRKDAILIKDITNLTNVFIETFIEGGILNKDSDVVFNPRFGSWSQACGGADADIYIDGVLYDFKCTKTLYKDWAEIGQVYGYYLLYGLCKTDKLEEEEPWIAKPIDAIALYKGRHGLINKFVIKDSDKEYDKVDLNVFREAIVGVHKEKSKEKAKMIDEAFRVLPKRKKEIFTTSLIHRYERIPFECFMYLKGQRIRTTLEGYGVIEDVCIEDGRLYFICKYDDNSKRLRAEFATLIASTDLIYEDEEAAIGKMIYHSKYGLGTVKEIIPREHITELNVSFQKKGFKLIEKESGEYFVARKINPRFSSRQEYPFVVGEKVIFKTGIFNGIPVYIDSILEKDNKDFISIYDANKEHFNIPVATFSMNICDEADRKDLYLVETESENRIYINEELQIGTKVKYIEKRRNEDGKVLFGEVSSIYHNNDFLCADVNFDQGEERTFIGRRCNLDCLK